MAADYFCERRRNGVLNIADKGTIVIDGTEYQ
jgi:5-keto 4-deoxyuronate isomerase